MTTAIRPDARLRSTAATSRYLCVELQAELYALPILSIQEIQAYAPPTPVPRMPGHVCGVANVHGEIVPVIDLRLRLGMPGQPRGPHTVIVYVGAGPQVVGLIVDLASRVLDLDPAQIKPAPAIANVDLSFVSGIARSGDRVLVILDVEALLRGDPALAAAATATAGAAPIKEGSQ